VKVHHIPSKNGLPPSGGVFEHCRQLLRHLELLGVELVSANDADVTHVQTAYPFPWERDLDVFTCHGGFLPSPIKQVQTNLARAWSIISVAQWIVDEFFPEYRHKTVVIPNGVDLAEWEDLPPSGIEPGFIFWGKEFCREDWGVFHSLAIERPDLRFVSTLFDSVYHKLPNLQAVGVQDPIKLRSLMNDCAVYVSTGSEVCPTMILEAWACGKPVLAWNEHGNRELMQPPNGRWLKSLGGCLYSTFDEALIGLSHCETNAEGIGAAGRAEVERKYQWADLAKRTVEVYERCMIQS
jgi:glycosyltransferase involved in cell wall biosynthesis